MEDEEQNELKNIIHFLNDIPELKIKENINDNFQYLESSFQNSLRDNSFLANIRDLKQNPFYYLTKWSIILTHSINLDNYYNYFTKDDNIINPELYQSNNSKKKYKKKYEFFK